MKNSIVIFLSVSTVFLQGMEVQNSFDFLVGPTTVRLTKGCIYDVDGQVDLMVVGTNQQNSLHLPWGSDKRPGFITEVYENKVFIHNKDDDSASDEEIYKPCNHRGFVKNPPTKKIQSKVIQVVEPRIFFQDGDLANDYYYHYFELKNSNGYCTYINKPYYREKAIEKAKKDLAICYHNVLSEGLKENKSIALPTLGMQVGFPRKEAAGVAVKAIIDFIAINNNDNVPSYELIHLFVKKGSEFELYNNLFMERSDLRLRSKMLLLLCINKKYEKRGLQLPSEIMRYISLYMLRLIQEK